MLEEYTQVTSWLQQYPELHLLTGLCLLTLAAWAANWIIKRILISGLQRLLRAIPLGGNDIIAKTPVISRLANVVPALVLTYGIVLVPHMPEWFITTVRNVCAAFIVLTIMLAINTLLTLLNEIYQRRSDARTRPIKGYIQILKIALYAITTILIISALLDKSPLILLSGLGAMAAVLMLVFQDTLLSLVASVQISSNDIIRVGDWIEMPQLNADGDVVDIALHTVKVQNWDKTITTIPTRRFITDPFKNWRGMSESGGRRIKRSIWLDQQSVHFLNQEERQRLYRFRLLNDYLHSKKQEIADWNHRLEESGKEPVNTRRITNIGTFRAYIEYYLRSHPGIHQGMTLMVRQLSPGAEGLPLEIYCFTNTTSWIAYESIQADIFDHLLAILPEFGLSVFQHPSGMDLRGWAQASADNRHS